MVQNRGKQLLWAGMWVLLSAIILIKGYEIIAAAPQAPDATLPAGFTEDILITGLTNPTAVAWTPDGRMLIAQKNGVVRVYAGGALLPTPFVDISSQVNNIWDRGLLGIAVHPDFPTTPYVYLLYTYDPPEVVGNTGLGGPDGLGARVSRLLRVTADPNNLNVALPGSELVILGTNSIYANIGNPNNRSTAEPPSCQNGAIFTWDCLPSDSPSHTIGTLRFAPDGSLYVGNGDGADFSGVDPRAVRVQSVDSLAGKIMRINPLTGGTGQPADGYADNPFYNGDLTSNRSRVYNFGLRNPYRFTIHPITGEVYIGDVGYNTWEEMNRGTGANFGWPCYEGRDGGVSQQQTAYASQPVCQALYAAVAGGTATVAAPLFAYDHTGGGASINSGDFYAGTTYPAVYQGALFYGDYNRQQIWYMTFDAGGNVVSAHNPFGTAVTGIVQLISGPDTNLYYVDYNNGRVIRIRYVGAGNVPPVAAAAADPTAGPDPLLVNFSSLASYDPDGDPLTYHWDFGDGNSSNLPDPAHTYLTAGTFTATLTITDTSSLVATDTVVILSGYNPPVATILTPATSTQYRTADVTNFSGTGVDIEDGVLPGSSLHWEILIHHNDHIHYFFDTTGNSGSFNAEDHEDNTYFELCLTVTDSVGLQDQACVDLYPEERVYTFDTVPSGLELTYSGVTYTAPFTVTTVVGGLRTVAAPVHQAGYTFNAWSDGGSATHDIIILDTPQTLVATYGYFVWDGGGVTNNWSEAANWQPDVVPGANDTALFNGTSVKDALVDTAFGGQVGALNVQTGYSGVISMTTQSLQVNGDFLMAEGTLAVARPQWVDSFTQTYSTFTGATGLQLNGNAAITADVLRLTATTPGNQRGTAFYNAPFTLEDTTSFEVRFDFRVHGSNGADGMVFMVQNAATGNTALGAGGGGLGYGGITPSLAVEIDNYDNGAADPNANHLGILTQGNVNTHLATYTPGFDLEDNNAHTLWVVYDGVNNVLQVYLSQTATTVRPATPVMSLNAVNLPTLLGDQLYFGFGGGTGGQVNNHDVQNWMFTITSPTYFRVLGDMSHSGGVLQQSQVVTNANVPFLLIDDGAGNVKYRGVSLITAGNLGETAVQVRAIGASESCTTGPLVAHARRCYNISPATIVPTTVRLWALDSERNGIPLNQLAVFHYNSGAGTWDEMVAFAVFGTDGGSYVYAEAEVSSFSPFLLGQAGSSPTALTLTNASVYTGFPVGMVVLVLCALLTLTVFKRRGIRSDAYDVARIRPTSRPGQR